MFDFLKCIIEGELSYNVRLFRRTAQWFNILYITQGSPRYVSSSSVTTQPYYSIIDYIPYAVHFISGCNFVTGSWYLLILFSPLSRSPHPPNAYPAFKAMRPTTKICCSKSCHLDLAGINAKWNNSDWERQVPYGFNSYCLKANKRKNKLTKQTLEYRVQVWCL